MKRFRDEEGNLYHVDRETGERTLIQPAESAGEVSEPEEVADIEDEES